MTGKMRRVWLGATVVCSLAVAVAVGSAGGKTGLTSRGPDGTVVHGDSSTYGTSLSASGRLALFTVDDDALPGAAGTMDVYVRDRKSGRTRLVSRSTSGEPANDTCGDGPAISGDGRFVAFRCNATNLGGEAPGVFVRDLDRGTTKLVSKSSAGVPASGGASRPAISADGRFVVFESNSDELPGNPGITDAYVRDRREGRTRLVSKATDGTPVDDNSSRYPSISANGRFVVFQSSSDLLPGGAGTADVYVRDRRTGTTRLVSKSSGGAPGNRGSSPSPGAISADGRFVVFESTAGSLGATLSGSVILRDLVKRTTRVISRTANGGLADGDEAAISANARFVAYGSGDDDLPGRSGVLDVYRFDRRTKRTIHISRSGDGKAGSDDSFYASISSTGVVVAFTSRANNLSDRDDNSVSNTFVRIP
jgi:Tol biopolymer transport system component